MTKQVAPEFLAKYRQEELLSECIEPEEIADAVLFLASSVLKHITESPLNAHIARPSQNLSIHLTVKDPAKIYHLVHANLPRMAQVMTRHFQYQLFSVLPSMHWYYIA